MTQPNRGDYPDHNAYYRAWYRANRELANSTKNAYYKANINAYKERKRRYRLQNSRQLKLSSRNWKLRNRGKSCGLHVPWNLQILSNIDNCAKGNREPD